MSYSGAGEPAPAPGTASGYAFFRGMFDYIFAIYNALDTAALVKDGNGGVGGLTYVGVALSGAFSGFAAAAGNTYTGTPFSYSKSGGGSWSVNNDGSITTSAGIAAATGTFSGSVATNVNLTAAGQLIAGSGSVAITTAAGLLDASKLSNAVAVGTILSDYRPAASASAGQIAVGAGGAYVDSNGQAVGPLNLQAAAMPTQPTGTNVQYVGVTLAPATGAPVITAGAVAASLGAAVQPLLPTANKPDAMVIWRGATTNPSGVIAAADIIDLRNLGSGGAAAGGAGTDSGVRSAQLWIAGTNGILPSALDSTNGATASRFHTNLLRDLSTDASVNDSLFNTLPDDLLARTIVTGGGAGVQVLASAAGSSPGPVALTVGGSRRKIVATASTVPQAGGSGPRYLIADAGGTGPTWALVNPMPGPTLPSLATTQRIIGSYWYDSGSALLKPSTSVDFSNVAGLTSGNVKGETVSSNGATGTTTITGNSAYQAIANIPTTTFYLPKTQTVLLISNVAWVPAATETNTQIQTFVDGSALIPRGLLLIPGYATPTGFASACVAGIVTLAAGAHTVTQQAFVTTGNSLQIYCQWTYVDMLILA